MCIQRNFVLFVPLPVLVSKSPNMVTNGGIVWGSFVNYLPLPALGTFASNGLPRLDKKGKGEFIVIASICGSVQVRKFCVSIQSCVHCLHGDNTIFRAVGNHCET